MIYVFHVKRSSHAVAPLTIGTLFNGAIYLSKAYTSASLVVYYNTIKLLPKQQVSAFVSHSFAAEISGSGCWWFADTDPVRLLILVLTLAIYRPENCQLLFLLCWACSFMPHMMVPCVVTWLTWDLGSVYTSSGTLEETWDLRLSISLCICSINILFTPP